MTIYLVNFLNLVFSLLFCLLGKAPSLLSPQLKQEIQRTKKILFLFLKKISKTRIEGEKEEEKEEKEAGKEKQNGLGLSNLRFLVSLFFFFFSFGNFFLVFFIQR